MYYLVGTHSFWNSCLFAVERYKVSTKKTKDILEEDLEKYKYKTKEEALKDQKSLNEAGYQVELIKSNPCSRSNCYNPIASYKSETYGFICSHCFGELVDIPRSAITIENFLKSKKVWSQHNENHQFYIEEFPFKRPEAL